MLISNSYYQTKMLSSCQARGRTDQPKKRVMIRTILISHQTRKGLKVRMMIIRLAKRKRSLLLENQSQAQAMNHLLNQSHHLGQGLLKDQVMKVNLHHRLKMKLTRSTQLKTELGVASSQTIKTTSSMRIQLLLISSLNPLSKLMKNLKMSLRMKKPKRRG